MSKKTLLNESQIRSFMKLAKLEPLTPGFVEGLTKNADDLDEGRGRKMRAEDEEMEEGRVSMRAEDELDEQRGMRDEDEVEEGMRAMRDEDEMDEVRTGLGPDYDLTRPKRGHGRGTGAADGLEEQEEIEEAAHEDAELGDAGDEMEMGAELEDPAADTGKMVSVDDFLSALERALEDAMGEEVEIDADESEADEPADAMDAMDDEPADDMMEAKHEDDEKLEEAEHADKEEKVDEALMESITKRVAKRILMEALNAKK
jgi:hypothetical protein